MMCGHASAFNELCAPIPCLRHGIVSLRITIGYFAHRLVTRIAPCLLFLHDIAMTFISHVGFGSPNGHRAGPVKRNVACTECSRESCSLSSCSKYNLDPCLRTPLFLP